MDFINFIFLDNTVSNYLVVAGIILLAIVFKRLISRYATSVIFKMAGNKWAGMDKAAFDDVIISPLERIFIVIVTILALDRLKFPSAFEFTIHKVSSRQMVDTVVSAIFIICVILLLIRFLDFLVLVIRHQSSNPDKHGEHQLLYFFKDLIKVVLVIFGLVLILKFSFQFNIGNLVTGLSIVGAALALSARESLENLIASFIIFFDKPFETGDMVKVNNISGNVERIGLRSTRIRTIEKSLVTVPNKQMVDSVLDNWSSRNVVRNEIKILLSAHSTSADLEKAVEKIREIFSSQKEIESHSVYLQEINNENALIQSIYFTPLGFTIEQLNALKQKLNLEIKKMQETHDIKSASLRNVKLIDESAG